MGSLSRSSASSSAAHSPARPPHPRTTSSTGSKRPRAAGTPIPLLSSGPASVSSGASAAVSATTMPSAAQAPPLVARSIADLQRSINGDAHAK